MLDVQKVIVLMLHKSIKWSRFTFELSTFTELYFFCVGMFTINIELNAMFYTVQIQCFLMIAYQSVQYALSKT